MRAFTLILFTTLALGVFAQSTERPCGGDREREELMARMKEIGRRLAEVQTELDLLQKDTTIVVPEGRVQRMDSLQAMRTRGKHALLELDKKLISLQED